MNERCWLHSSAAGLLNYNVVEGILLFNAALVCLMGVLLEVTRPTDDFYESSRDNLTNTCVAGLTAETRFWRTWRAM